ncbi:Protein of unknown function [Pyronema omphalodes CBS 100304]|uniref:Uncharacterized protein n=1 Tax=Pyronema omphalodes (strain CBS 100304) TaxID=1076935 RepID=U4L190_PYROM|nr:Protein of unknown function [Pyronema omphalodes CBS 100304]
MRVLQVGVIELFDLQLDDVLKGSPGSPG